MKFIPFTEEEKERANSVDLPEFLQMRGETIRSAGREYVLIYTDETGTHDSIAMHGSMWFDHKHQVGGGAIQFMQYHYGMNFPDAVEALLGNAVHHAQRKSPYSGLKQKKAFRLPEASPNMHRVYAYLLKQRCIAKEIVDHFARQKTLYEDAEYHNAVFVGVDENGVPRQAHKRSTITFGKSFRMTCEGSDTRYSFAHFGNSGRLFVFEAPIDLLSFLTLYPENWQAHSYLALNGVYENALVQALKTHGSLQGIVLCTDNDEGGIEAAYRLRDILNELGYHHIKRFSPSLKDWNEMLKAQHGIPAQPAVPHRRRETYLTCADDLEPCSFQAQDAGCIMQKLFWDGQYQKLAAYALSGAAYYLNRTGCANAFSALHRKLKQEYCPYKDHASRQAERQRCTETVRRSFSTSGNANG